MQLYRKIMVALDCSPVDNTIIGHVKALAQQNDAQVYLMHVVHSHTLDQDRVLREETLKSMEAYRKTFQDAGIEAEVIVRSGEPGPELLKQIEQSDYDLVAMATHGHSFLGDLLFGSVSRTLKHSISIPLLLVGPEKKGGA